MTPETKRLLASAVKSTKHNAKRKSLEIAPNLASLVRTLYYEQGGRCAITKQRFDGTVGDGFTRRKKPSIDRIDCTNGYVEGNIRLVWTHVNFARADFGDAALYELCDLILNAKRIDVLALEESKEINLFTAFVQ